MLGLVNGSFYAMLSLGLAVIFGLMGIVNFAHGAFYTLGAFAALLGLQLLGINYWVALLLAPLAVGLVGIARRAAAAAPPLRARPALRTAAHLRTGAHLPGLAPPGVRRHRAVLSGARSARRRREPRLHVPAPVPRLGGPRVGGGVLQYLVRHRAHAPRSDAARGDRERPAAAGLRRQRAAAGGGDLRRRRSAGGARRRAGRAGGAGQLRRWAARSSSSCLRSS